MDDVTTVIGRGSPTCIAINGDKKKYESIHDCYEMENIYLSELHLKIT